MRRLGAILQDIPLPRRRFLELATTGLMGSILLNCTRSVTDANIQSGTNNLHPFVVDIHCHVFNASDLLFEGLFNESCLETRRIKSPLDRQLPWVRPLGWAQF